MSSEDGRHVSGKRRRVDSDPQAGSNGSASSEQSRSHSPELPRQRITRLSESVINRIAAGEIIHRPANALKELIENSLDAGATMIRVTLKDGGMKMLQIQDDGHGVSTDDLPLLCERFATSKLRNFDDLSRMATFGFRGEALASISFVSAQMTVTTKTRNDKTAWKAAYAEGALANPKKGGSTGDAAVQPKPCAGTDGTTITAQDLFYNVPQRKRALKSAAEEYNRALDVVGKYALHYGSRGVGFVCKKAGSNTADLSTPSASTTTALDTVRLLHGNSVARELLHLRPTPRHPTLGFSVEGYLSNANWSSKQRTTFLCFINNRLVDCAVLKRSLEAFYASLLPKGSHPWMYISLNIDASRVDVNVHPTKKEVHFLDEEEIVEEIVKAAGEVLSDANRSRSFNLTQAVLPGTQVQIAQPAASASTQAQTQGAYPQHQVRVDARTRTLDSMFGSAQALPGSSSDVDVGADADMDTDPGDAQRRNARQSTTAIPQSDCTLTSIKHLRAQAGASVHKGLTEILQSHTFVGVVDLSRSVSLIQHGTRLYLINHDALIEEFVYQGVLRQFGSLRGVSVGAVEDTLDVEDLLTLAIESTGQADEAESKTGGLNVTSIAHRIAHHLLSISEMLTEYFSLTVAQRSDRVILTQLPSILPHTDVLIPPTNLPMFLLRLGTEVSYSNEEDCFQSFAWEFARAHRLRNVPEEESEKWKSMLKHTWFPLFAAGKRNGFAPSKKVVVEGQAVTQLAALSDLYRIFERC